MNKFSTRDQIERAIKDLGISRSALFEVSKFGWNEILCKIIDRFVQKTYYTQGLHWAWERFKGSQDVLHLHKNDGYKYIPDLVDDEYVWFIVEDNKGKFWIYEGMPDAIAKVIEAAYYIDEYYIVSKKYEWILCEDHHRIIHGVGDKISDEINRFKALRPELIWL